MKRLKQTLSVLGAALVIGAGGLATGAAFEATLTPNQTFATCNNSRCNGSAWCVESSYAFECWTAGSSCFNWFCSPE